MTIEATPTSTALAAFRARVVTAPQTTQLRYFDRTLTVAELDAASDAIAAALAESGVSSGDRVAVFLQNMPHYVVSILAIWKLNAILVPINPMLRPAELRYHLNDCGAVALIALDVLWASVAREVVADTAVTATFTVASRSYQSVDDPRVLTLEAVDTDGTIDFDDAQAEFAGRRVKHVEPQPDSPAFFCYTSGTTGDPKAAVCSHRNAAAVIDAILSETQLGAHSTIVALAPLFHITGLMVQLVPALVAGCPLVLSFRFHPEVMLDSIRTHRPTFAVGPITAYIGLLQDPTFVKADFASFDRVYSGGAPISPATARSFLERTGKQVLGAYGMTEATSATHLGPLGRRAPTDPTTGALAVGKPTPGTQVRIVDDNGVDLPPGTAGEVVMRSPGVITRYWNRPDATAATIRDGWLYSGDIGVVDDEGWLFLVDRKKDLINCSGFKVWPREVEDVLYEHPAVREAAVIGVPDDYRGETVKAFVSLNTDTELTGPELIEFARSRLAAYKRPSEIVVLDELPKTTSGKILRRSLRPTSTISSATLN